MRFSLITIFRISKNPNNPPTNFNRFRQFSSILLPETPPNGLKSSSNAPFFPPADPLLAFLYVPLDDLRAPISMRRSPPHLNPVLRSRSIHSRARHLSGPARRNPLQPEPRPHHHSSCRLTRRQARCLASGWRNSLRSDRQSAPKPTDHRAWPVLHRFRIRLVSQLSIYRFLFRLRRSRQSTRISIQSLSLSPRREPRTSSHRSPWLRRQSRILARRKPHCVSLCRRRHATCRRARRPNSAFRRHR